MDFICKIIAVIFFYCNFALTYDIPANSSVTVHKVYPDTVNLPDNHLPYYYNRFPEEVDLCIKNDTCKYREYLKKDYPKFKHLCWGYEDGCSRVNAYSKMQCPGKVPTYLKNKDEQNQLFYKKTDFGYVKDLNDRMLTLCTPLYPDDTLLQCTPNLQFCRARNVLISFESVEYEDPPFRYRTDVLTFGDLGGYCRFNNDLYSKQLSHTSALQSWAPELKAWTIYPERPKLANACNFIMDKPVYIMKIDATTNMYHHFCDFFNLYVSLHVNNTNVKSFDDDVQILIWETYPYYSPFSDAFKAFSRHPIINIKDWAKYNMCIKKLLLPLLPRMIFGLYYNTPIVGGCEKSGLFQAFSEFMLHRLKVPLFPKRNQRVRITFLERNTKFRNVKNSAELILAMHQNDTYKVNSVIFDHRIKFVDQLEIIRNTDVFIGMHGAGLTHLLFLPKWASVFELYNCEDSECYKDLARLKGVNYFTWENNNKLRQQDKGKHPSSGGAHAKFTNYWFDKDEFIRMVNKAVAPVLDNKEYQDFERESTEAFGYFDQDEMQVVPEYGQKFDGLPNGKKHANRRDEL